LLVSPYLFSVEIEAVLVVGKKVVGKSKATEATVIIMARFSFRKGAR
jgi:hypothetical protein